MFWCIILVAASSFAAITETSSLTRNLETNLPQPSVFVHPPPEDPDPGRNWDEYQPPKCTVVLQNSRFFPVHKVDDYDILRHLESYICRISYEKMCLNQTRYPISEEREACERFIKTDDDFINPEVTRKIAELLRETKAQKEIELTESSSLGVARNARDEIANASKATITGHWKLSPTNAHIAFDNIIIVRGAATTTIPKSTVVTVAPTPAASYEQIMKHIKSLPVSEVASPLRIYNRTICGDSELRHITNSAKCLAVFAGLEQPHTEEDFLSWLALYGWAGSSEGTVSAKATVKANAIRYQKAVNRAFDFSDLKTIDTPLLLELTGFLDHIRWIFNNDTFPASEPYYSGVCASDDPYWAFKHNISRYTEPYDYSICFFSSHSPVVKGDKTPSCDVEDRSYAAVVTYSWWSDTVSTPNRAALRALAQSDHRLENLTECEFKNEFPELATHPPLLLRPISGGMLAAPELPNRPQPSDNQEDLTTTPEIPKLGAPSPPSPPSQHIQVDAPPMGGIPEGKGNSRGVGQSSENSLAITGSMPLPTILIGDQRVRPTYIGGPQPVIVIGTNTLPLNGPASTIGGVPVSFSERGLLVDAKVIPIVPELPIILGTEHARVIAGPDNRPVLILGSSTITATRSEHTVNGHVIRFASNSVVVDGTSTYQFSQAPPTTVGGADGAIKGQQAEYSTTVGATITPTPRASQGGEVAPTISSAHSRAKSGSETKKSTGTRGYRRPWILQVLVTACVSLVM